jgi:hypothetical protein
MNLPAASGGVSRLRCGLYEVRSVRKFINCGVYYHFFVYHLTRTAASGGVLNPVANKKGRKLSATLLTQSLNHILDCSLKLRGWYERLSRYKMAGLVRTGLRRRVFAEIFQMLKKQEYHYGREAEKHEMKMRHYRSFLEKQKRHEMLKITA